MPHSEFDTRILPLLHQVREGLVLQSIDISSDIRAYLEKESQRILGQDHSIKPDEMDIFFEAVLDEFIQFCETYKNNPESLMQPFTDIVESVKQDMESLKPPVSTGAGKLVEFPDMLNIETNSGIPAELVERNSVFRKILKQFELDYPDEAQTLDQARKLIGRKKLEEIDKSMPVDKLRKNIQEALAKLIYMLIDGGYSFNNGMSLKERMPYHIFHKKHIDLARERTKYPKKEPLAFLRAVISFRTVDHISEIEKIWEFPEGLQDKEIEVAFAFVCKEQNLAPSDGFIDQLWKEAGEDIWASIESQDTHHKQDMLEEQELHQTRLRSVIRRQAQLAAIILITLIVGAAMAFVVILNHDPTSHKAQRGVLSDGVSNTGLAGLEGVFGQQMRSASPTSPESDVVQKVELKNDEVITKEPEYKFDLPDQKFQEANLSLNAMPDVNLDKMEWALNDVSASVPERSLSSSDVNFFGHSTNVEIARPNIQPMKALIVPPSPAVPENIKKEPEVEDGPISALEGYRSLGRLELSELSKLQSFAEELGNLTLIQRFLSRQMGGREVDVDSQRIILQANRAQIMFRDGVAFSVSFVSRKLDAVQVFQKSGNDAELDTGKEALRGIRFLADAVRKQRLN